MVDTTDTTQTGPMRVVTRFGRSSDRQATPRANDFWRGNAGRWPDCDVGARGL
jgi:hypothetical protein